MPAFLLEIGLEEIPAGMITAAQGELAQRFDKLLTRERLASDDLRLQSFSTPRRLAVLIDGLLPRQADLEEEVVGPSMKVAYKDGMPTPAAIAFAKKSGVEVEALKTVQNAKGEYVAATIRRQGRSAAEVLTDLAPAEIAGIYWPKNMHWRAGKPERFVRPVRWLLALLDEEVLPMEFAGVTAASVSYGHRILHGDAPVVIRRPKEYAEKLVAAFVQADPEARKHRIRKALDAATRIVPGARWREDENLVEIVTNLTEWPSVILGSFDPLRLPKEVLITVMRDHQKYFALEDANGNLLPHFLAVLNIAVDAAGANIIRHGNERVLRARFNDAQFFWDVDQKIPLIDRVEMLKHVTFHKDLGSYWDKTQANLKTAKRIARKLHEVNPADTNLPDEAILLAKADLTTEMVKEFTELQGIVGGLYARDQKLSEEIANAIYEQYRPQGSGDAIPRTEAGAILALADKMTAITQMFGKGYAPTGSKDPFALRRAGTGVVRILIENDFVRHNLDLTSVVLASFTDADLDEYAFQLKVYDFMLDRMESFLNEYHGIRPQVARAVRNSKVATYDTHSAWSLPCGRIADFARKLNLLTGKSQVLAVAELLKRAANIQRQARERGIEFPKTEIPRLLQHPAEKELARQVTALNDAIQKNYREGNYSDVITAIAGLQPTLNAFFDSVMVMVEDEKLRNNRLALLARTESTVRWAADFSELSSIQ